MKGYHVCFRAVKKSFFTGNQQIGGGGVNPYNFSASHRLYSSLRVRAKWEVGVLT